jgi:DNA repair protein RadC
MSAKSAAQYLTKTAAASNRKRYGYRLVRECDAPVSAPERRPVRQPRDVVAIMAPMAQQEPSEVFWVLCLDSQHCVPADGVVVVTRGILNSSLVHPREVFREAILRNAAAVVLCHNHPSGDPTPSADDRMVTEQLAAAGRLLDIPVHDHVIVGPNGPSGRYTSFAEAGLL